MTLEERFNALGGTVPRRVLAAGRGPGWLADGLIATEAGRIRLQRYALAGFPPPDRRRLCVVGGEFEAADTLHAAMTRIPDPVAAHAVRNVVVVAVGGRYDGWVTGLPELPDPEEQPGIVAVNAGGAPDEVAAVLAHELAHAWLHLPMVPLSEPRLGPESAACAREVTRAVAVGPSPDQRFQSALFEWQVARLARSWGFTGTAADEAEYGTQLRRARLERDRK